MTLRYEPGTAHAVARRRVVVLLPESHDPELLAGLWDRLGEDVGIVEVLQELTGAFGSDLRTVPPFAVVECHGARVNVAVRGAMNIAVDRADGERVRVDGREVSTWSERGIDEVERVYAAVGDAPADEAVAGPLLPLDAGIVLAAAVSWSAQEHPGLPEATEATDVPEEAAPVPDAEPDAVVEPSVAVRDAAAEPTAEPDPVPVASAVFPGLGASTPPASEPDPAPVALVPAAEAEAVAPSSPAEPEPAPSPVAEAVRPRTRATAHVGAPVAPAVDEEPRSQADILAGLAAALHAHDAQESPAPVADPEPADEDDYGHLWGSTVLRTVEDAAVRAIEDAEEVPAGQAPTAQAAPVPLPVGPSVTDETPQDVTLAPIDTDEDHDGYTMFSEAIADLRAAAGAPAEPGPFGGALGTAPDPAGHPAAYGEHPAYGEQPAYGEPVPAGGQRMAAYAPGAGADLYAAAEPVPYTTDVYGYDPSVDASAYGPPAPVGYRPGPSVGYNVPSPGGYGGPATGAYGAPAAVLDQADPMAGAYDAAPLAGPDILARACSQGHANSPSREVCAVCGSPLVGDAAPMSRPPLGRLHVSTGQSLDLDRDVVVGRRPRSVRGENDLVRLVTVPSPQQDISRSHLEITLEGWHVLLADLNTTNGTTLLRPGQAPRRLHPGEPTLMADGDVIDMGDGVTLTFAGLQ